MNSETIINHNWLFRMDHEGQGLGLKWFRPDLDASAWIPVTLPHAFDDPPLQIPGAEGHGWYRLDLDDVPARANERWVLRFEQVNYCADVWVNGEKVGCHAHGGYTPFEIDITAALDPEIPRQTIVVRADNLRSKERCPEKVLAWRNKGGILRHVVLIKSGPTRIESVGLHDAGTGRGPIRVAVSARVRGKGSLSLRLIGPFVGGKAAGKQICLEADVDESGAAELELPGRCRWSPEKPQLFKATFELRRGNRLVQRKIVTTGFRVVAARGNRFLVNGRRCWVNCINYLFDDAERGMIGNPAKTAADLHRIKALGADTIRSHIPMPQYVYDRCDELGLMVWHDIPLYWWHNRDGLAWGVSQMASFDAMRPQIAELVNYDYNHPSVVMRIMGNECGFYDDASQSAMRSICEESRRLDPTRLTAICAYVQQDEGVDLSVDAILCNFYRDHKTKTISALPREVRPTTERLQKVAALFPDKPIFVSEVGFEGVAHLHGETYHTEEFQAAAFTEYWEQLTGTGLLSGFAFWCWADYRYIEAKPWAEAFRTSSPTIGCWGLVTEDRRYVKLSYEAVRDCFAAAPGRRK